MNIANKIFPHKQTPRAKLTASWLYGALIIVLSAWILHSFLEALLAVCVTAIASWPLYRRFAACLPSRLPRSAVSLIFTCVITVCVLAPLVFAFGSLLTEANDMLLDLAAADKQGLAVPEWLEKLPLVGSWATARWQSDLAHPGAVSLWAQRTDLTALLGWAQSFGEFMTRHAFIILFTILLLYFLYEEGESLTDGFKRALRQWIGVRADGHIDLATRAVRASVNSMLLVALFDGIGTAIACAIASVPSAAVWGAIAGALELARFLGYVAVIALALKLAMTATEKPALVVFSFGCAVLFCGDKILRPSSRAGERDCHSFGSSWAASAASRCSASPDWSSARSCSLSRGKCGNSAFAIWCLRMSRIRHLQLTTAREWKVSDGCHGSLQWRAY